jgi:7-keto-8-aminopelargonate synthetase-like enzyme
LSARVEIVLATLSKALGSVGGMIAGSRVLIDWLTNRARSFIYSTALPPGVIAASHAAVEIARGPEGGALRAHLQKNIGLFRENLPAAWRDSIPAAGAIQPLPCGEASAALHLAQALRDRGFFIPAIRYPTVPRGTARLRVTLSAVHTGAEIDTLGAALADLRPAADK